VYLLLPLQYDDKVNEANSFPLSGWSIFVDSCIFGCHSGEFCAGAVMCNIINFDTGARCQTTQDIMVAMMNEPKRRRGEARTKDFVMVQSPQQLHQTFPEMAAIEEYIPSNRTFHKVPVLNATSVNLDHCQTSTSYSLMGMPPLDLFGVRPHVHVQRWFITPEQKERQLELARVMKTQGEGSVTT